MNNTVPTAEEFLKDNMSSPTKGWSEKKRLIEFARLHCEAQLKAILEKVETKIEYSGIGEEVIIDKDSIIEAYPLNQIK